MMKYVLAFTLLITFVIQGYSQVDTCARETTFGTTMLCLPVIDGLNEAYLDPNVKYLADATEVAMNSVLGYYLNDYAYGKRESLGEINIDDYCKIYGTNEIAAIDVDKPMLNEMSTIIGANFIQKNWEEIIGETLSDELNIEIGVPTMIENFNVNDQSFTYVMLTKYSTPDEADSYTLAMTINGMLVKQRLVWMAYYLSYENEETFVLLKEKNKKVIDAFLEAN